MKIKPGKATKTILKIILSVAALYFVFTKIQFTDVLEVYKKSSLVYLIVAALLFALSKFVAALRLNRFLSSIKVLISHKFNLRLYLLGMFYNLFLPGGIGGDGYKIYLLNKQFGVKAKKIFLAILFDRIGGLVALFILCCLLAYLIPVPQIFKYFIWLLIPAGLLVFYFIIQQFFEYFKNIFLIINLQSLLVQFLQLLSAYFILIGIGQPSFIPEYLFVFLVSSIVATLPVTIGGIGSREITFLYGAQLIGLDINASIALSLMFYIITAFVSFFGIYYSINTKKINPDYSENQELSATKD